MPIHDNDARKLIADALAALQTTLKSHDHFLRAIYEEGDWAFVIKAHALLEAVITQALVDSIGDVRIIKIVERLPLSNEEYGKTEIGKEFGILSKEQRRFIREFSALRNALAHKVENANFTFLGYFDSLESSRKKAFLEAIVWSETEPEAKHAAMKWTSQSPKLALRLFLFTLLSDVTISGSHASNIRKVKEKALETAEALFKGARQTEST